MIMLNWGKLLSTKRERQSTSQTNNNVTKSHRNQFEADYDRIIGSSSVRRLQDKAQVFPLQENDFVRTRLTHSIEVSAIARSLGKAIGKKIETIDENFKPEQTDEIAAILQTAGIIHDLGNPPFGHYGETVIQEWFKKYFKINEENSYDNERITEIQMSDYIHFDGNVQNLRIVTKLQTLNDSYGANFTYATLATIIKYPWNSQNSEHHGKFGFLQSEKDIVERIYEVTGLSEGIRHPLTYLLEAADDITYLCDDIEDGVKKGVINWRKEYDIIKQSLLIIDDNEKTYKKIFDEIEEFRCIRGKCFGYVDEPNKISNFPEEDLSDVRNFRNVMQKHMINASIKIFMDNYDLIMSGQFGNKELLNDKIWDNLKKELSAITKRNCYNCKEVLTLELVGDKVIRSLLDIFVVTLVNEKNSATDSKKRAGKLFQIMSSNYLFMSCCVSNKIKKFSDLTEYDIIQSCVDFISGMTDSYAVNLYKELFGVQLP